VKLRDYQERALAAVDECVALGRRAPLLVAPTGSGKTVIAAAMIQRNPNERVLFLAPRRELIHQTCSKLEAFGVGYGTLLAGDNRTNLYSRVQVASVDTLLSRLVRTQRLTLMPFDRIIIDEAHLGLTDSRISLLDRWPNAIKVGLTATPCRADGKALGKLYDELIEVATVSDLISKGSLVNARYFSVAEPDLKKVRTTAGDYNLGDLERVMDQPKLVGDIVTHALEHAGDRRTVVFATSIKHSVALAQEFMDKGVTAEHVDAGTPQHEREAIFKRFSEGTTQVLCNVSLASTGFDLPELDCVIFARPTKSLGLYLQMLGRGLRPSSGKKDCLVLDHAGNVLRHGACDEERYWTLAGDYGYDRERIVREKVEAEKTEEHQRKCPECSAVWIGGRECPECHHIIQPKARAVKTADGRLVEINAKVSKEALEQQRYFFQELKWFADQKGYSSGWASHKFKEKHGHWPTWDWQRLPGVVTGTATARWIQSRQIAWAKSKRQFAA